MSECASDLSVTDARKDDGCLVWCQPSGMWSMRLCNPASSSGPVCQAAYKYSGPRSLTLCCGYGRYLRYLVGMGQTAEITRIRHIYTGLRQDIISLGACCGPVPECKTPLCSSV